MVAAPSNRGGPLPTVPLHPEIEPLRDLIPIPDLNADVLPSLRGVPFIEPPELSDRVARVDHVIPGDPDVVVRVHTPEELEGPAPCLYSIHGGGYVLGSYDGDDAKFDVLCQRFGIVGVSVEYRLAPETPFPGPLDDCYAGLAWTYEVV